MLRAGTADAHALAARDRPSHRQRLAVARTAGACAHAVGITHSAPAIGLPHTAAATGIARSAPAIGLLHQPR